MMTWMFTTCLLLPQPPAPPIGVSRILASEKNQLTSITLDPAGTPLVDWIQSMARVLGWSLQYQPEDFANERLFATGTVTVPREQLVDYFHNMLRSRGLIVATVGEGAATQRSVVKIRGDKSQPRMLKSLAPFVTAEDILANKPLGAPLVTTQLVLQHVDARELATSLTGYCADLVESVRNVEGMNVLVITGWASTMRNTLELATTVDQMTGAALRRTSGRKDLESRVAQLAKRVNELEEILRNVSQALPKKPSQ